MSAYHHTPYRVLCQLVINSRSEPDVTWQELFEAALRDISVEGIAAPDWLAAYWSDCQARDEYRMNDRR